MAREDLLDQGGTRALEPDHEDRIARRIASSARPSEQGFVKRGYDLVDEGRHARLLWCQAPRPDCIALGIVTEALLVTATILERLAEREVKVKRVIVRDFPAKRLAHCGKAR